MYCLSSLVFVAGIERSDVAVLLQRWQPASPAVVSHTVSSVADERRLAHIAARAFSELGSKSQAAAALKRGDLALNGEFLVEGCRQVVDGDVLALTPQAVKPLSPRALEARCRFIQHLFEQGLRAEYEDEDVAVVYKPGEPDSALART